MIAVLLLEGSMPGDASGRHPIFISIFVPFCSNSSAPVDGVLRSQTPCFCVRLNWAAAISFFMQIRLARVGAPGW